MGTGRSEDGIDEADQKVSAQSVPASSVQQPREHVTMDRLGAQERANDEKEVATSLQLQQFAFQPFNSIPSTKAFQRRRFTGDACRHGISLRRACHILHARLIATPTLFARHKPWSAEGRRLLAANPE